MTPSSLTKYWLAVERQKRRMEKLERKHQKARLEQPGHREVTEERGGVIFKRFEKATP
jgi:hypothetical protein